MKTELVTHNEKSAIHKLLIDGQSIGSITMCDGLWSWMAILAPGVESGEGLESFDAALAAVKNAVDATYGLMDILNNPDAVQWFQGEGNGAFAVYAMAGGVRIAQAYSDDGKIWGVGFNRPVVGSAELAKPVELSKLEVKQAMERDINAWIERRRHEAQEAA